MNRWLDIFHETPVADRYASANSANSADRSDSGAIGTIGTIGTGIEAKAGEKNVASAQHLIAGPSASWDTTDWQALYDERAAIRESDGELPRPEAERLALADCIDWWLTQNPPPPTDDAAGCVHCGADLGEDGVPVLAGTGHTWLHSACHAPWLAERRRHATEALRAMGM